MSAIFGTCLSRDAAVDQQFMLLLARATAGYGIDGTHTLRHGRIGMGFQAFHTHQRSRLELQPVIDHLGNIVVLDGRLDNFQDLAVREGIRAECVPDSTIILKVFERHGVHCFSRLVGDWALALWSARDSVLYLARDHAGSRTLFYSNVPGETRWSSYLESFFVGNVTPEIEREYMARALAGQEIRELTPYKGILAVPPAHYVAVQNGRETVRSHWNWVADTNIVYRSEAEYDRHFLSLFESAVARRFEPGGPILAELSGGMDSTSIVCMADKIVRDSGDLSKLIDTVSYFDDTEPDWDERPYFVAAENHRNRRGIHLESSPIGCDLEPLILAGRTYPYPGCDSGTIQRSIRFEQKVGAGRYRIILSGIGGDELLGGVPTAMPELANYLRQGRPLKLVSRAFEWCMADRTPLVEMLWDTVTFTSHLYRNPRPGYDSIPPWLSQELRKILRHSSCFTAKPRELLAARPSALSSGQTWWGLLETLPHLAPNPLGRYEYRYPYLDRDLVEFLHRIPREQLVQPGRRRLLMRRALKEIVPAEILERKRKAFISRGPITHLRDSQRQVFDLFANPLLAAYGYIERDTFLRAFQAELAGGLKWVGHLTKAISLELWLRGLGAQPGLHCEAPSNLGAKFCPSSGGQTVSELGMLEASNSRAEI